jgi:hypothetical protein
MLSNNQEIVLDFLNTHFAMVAFLMPWKRITITTGTASEHLLYSLFNMNSIETWTVAANTEDDGLRTMTHTFIGLTVSLLLVCILSFLFAVFYPRETGMRFGLDLINFALGTVTLVLAVTSQSDFDKYWKHFANGNTNVDYEQMFLVVGVLTGQIFLSLLVLGDKFKMFYYK